MPSVGKPSARPALLLAALVALVFLVLMLTATRGHFVPQVVDLYLVMGYARAMAEGHAFHYNAGDPASTGATSLLHTVFLAAAHGLGFKGEGLVAFAILSGAACFIASVLLAARIAQRLSGDRESALAAALVALGGPVVWGFLYGSDIALFMLLSLALLDRLLADWSAASPWGVALVGSLLALARPEGLVVAAMIAPAWSLLREAGGGNRRSVLPWLPVGIGVSVLILYKSLTAQWLGTSVGDKSLLANYPLADALSLCAEYVVDVLRGLLLGFYPSQTPVGFARGWAPFYFPPLGLLLVLLAFLRPLAEYRAPLRLWACVLVVVCALVVPNVFMGVHFNRYVLWAVPSLLVFVAVGLGSCARLVARGDAEIDERVFRLGAGLLLLLGALSTLRFATLYGEMAGDVQRRDGAAATWITANLPAGVAMANIATSVEYLTGHRNVSLHGVTTPAFFGNRAAEREAGVWEALGWMPQGERPRYLITSVSAQESYPTMREVVTEPPLFRSASLSDDILIYPMTWEQVAKNRRLFRPESLGAVAALHEVDHLNVCDSHDEREHHYRFESNLGGIPLWGTARIDRYDLPDGRTERVIDAGRAILGEESFDIAVAPQKDVVIVMRTAPSAVAGTRRASGSGAVTIDLAEQVFNLEMDGAPTSHVSFRARPGWDELLFRVPGSAVARNPARIRLRGRYASFYFWFFQ